MIICDMETDGLYPNVTKIHCCVFFNLETYEWHKFTPDNINELPDYINNIKRLSMHNGIGFDLKVWRKLLGIEYKGEYFDTLLASRMIWPDKERNKYTDENGKEKSAKTPHGVENWGLEFNIAKPAHEDWSEFSEAMLHRCQEDVKIQALLYQHILACVGDMKKNDPRLDFLLPLRLEHKVWRIIEAQADYGWLFDLPAAYKCVDELQSIIEDIEGKLIPLLPKRSIRVSEVVCRAFRADGTISINASKWLQATNTDALMGDFSKVRFEDMNLGSDTQVKDYLLSKGWKPIEWNYKKDVHNKPLRDSWGKKIQTSPKLPNTAEAWDDVAQQLGLSEIVLLSERNKAAHRLAQIRGLISNVRPHDHRIEAQANTCATNTARMAHRIAVNIPKSVESVYYGKQMRSLFVVPEDKVLVGWDASALEARIEAHFTYPYDKTAALELIEGDIHSLNAQIFQTERQVAKNGKYAILYGCSPSKLATTLGKPIAMAQEIYDDYWNGNPALKQLKEDLEQAYDKYGYILSIDKRPLTIRYKHALINTLFQAGGSIAMKVALCIMHKTLTDKRIPFNFVGNFHDEIQTETFPEYGEVVGETGLLSLKEAGQLLKLNVELKGEYKIGKNWSETH